MKFVPIDIELKNGRTIEIRQAVDKDAADLIVAAKCYARTSEYLSLYDDEMNPSTKEEKAWIKLHACRNSLLLVVISEKEIIATLNVSEFQNRKMKHAAQLGISVLKEWRGMGVGKTMLQLMIDWAKSSSTLEIITLDVFSENTPAIELYKKHGFVKEGERLNYFKQKNGNYVNDIIMSLHLINKTI